MPQSPRDVDDEAVDRELERLDFRTLDLSTLDDESSLLGMPSRSISVSRTAQFKAPDGTILPWVRWTVTMALLLMGWFILWFPSTSTFQTSSSHDAWFMLICLGATTVGLALARWLWQWGIETADRARDIPQKPVVEWQFPPSVTRWGPALVLAGGGSALMLTSEGGSSWVGNGTLWFLLLMASIGVGLLGMRWIFLNASRPADDDKVRQARKPLVLPPWLKWVNLGLLIAAGLFTAFGSALFGGSNSEAGSFAFGGIGFAVGLFGAIWIARRFDETEKKIKEQTRHRQRE